MTLPFPQPLPPFIPPPPLPSSIRSESISSLPSMPPLPSLRRPLHINSSPCITPLQTSPSPLPRHSTARCVNPPLLSCASRAYLSPSHHPLPSPCSLPASLPSPFPSLPSPPLPSTPSNPPIRFIPFRSVPVPLASSHFPLVFCSHQLHRACPVRNHAATPLPSSPPPSGLSVLRHLLLTDARAAHPLHFFSTVARGFCPQRICRREGSLGLAQHHCEHCARSQVCGCQTRRGVSRGWG